MSSLKHLTIAAVIAAALAVPGTAQAGYISGWDLLQICKANPRQAGYLIQTAQCRGYVTGVSNTFSCSESLHGFTWDNTAEASPEALVKGVTTWFVAHPKTLRHKADGLVAAALSEIYPCK